MPPLILSAIMTFCVVQIWRKEPSARTAYKVESCIQKQGRRFKAREILVTKCFVAEPRSVISKNVSKIQKDRNCSSVVEWVTQGSKVREWDNRGFSLASKPYCSEDQIAVTVSLALIPVSKTQSCSTAIDVLGNNWNIT